MNLDMTKTTCPYCGVGCGVLMEKNKYAKYLFETKGDKTHPANFGRLCIKGIKLSETLGIDDRIKTPYINHKQASWNDALDFTSKGFLETIKKYGAESVAFYVSGQLLTEDYYIANKFIKGFIGTSNIDTNSRLCMSSSVAGHKRAFGSDSVPASYEDFDYADLIILVGSNMAYSHPIVYQRIKQAKKNNKSLKIISIDPRITATDEIVDLHLSISAGSDGFIFNSLLGYMIDNDLIDNDFIDNHTNNIKEVILNLKKYDYSLKKTSEICDISYNDLESFIKYFISSKNTITIYSQGINQSSSGVDKVNAIINCHLATGKIGKIGSAPFSITGQPNAMGGREVGGLANQLASHMDFDNEDIDRVKRFWNAPKIATKGGLKAVDMFDAILQGKIKAIWIIHTNPIVSMPQSSKIKKALEQCPLVVVSDIIKSNDTNQYANVLFPSLAWGEKEGSVSNSDRTISRQRAFVDNSNDIDSKADWEIIQEIAKRMGFEKEFDYKNSYEIFIEHCKLSAFENEKPTNENPHYKLRDFNLLGLSDLTFKEYCELKPIQWPIQKRLQGSKRMFEDKIFFTKNNKANFIAITPKLPTLKPNKKYPLVFNNGRLRDQWHTMGRTAKSSTLLKHISEPCLYLNEKDIEKYNLNEGYLVDVYNDLSLITLRVKKDNRLKINTCFSPIHWSDIYSSNAMINNLIYSTNDAISGQPEFKHTTVAIKPSDMKLYGVIYSSQKIEKLKLKSFDFWVEIKQADSYRYEIAIKDNIKDFRNYIDKLDIAPKKQKLFYMDNLIKDYRYIHLDEDKLDFILFFHKDYKSLLSRQYLSTLFDNQKYKQLLSSETNNHLLMGADNEYEDDGETICSCYGVGQKTIMKTIKEHNLKNVEQLSELLKAGSNCGSCLPELKACFD